MPIIAYGMNSSISFPRHRKNNLMSPNSLKTNQTMQEAIKQQFGKESLGTRIAAQLAKKDNDNANIQLKNGIFYLKNTT